MIHIIIVLSTSPTLLLLSRSLIIVKQCTPSFRNLKSFVKRTVLKRVGLVTGFVAVQRIGLFIAFYISAYLASSFCSSTLIVYSIHLAGFMECVSKLTAFWLHAGLSEKSTSAARFQGIASWYGWLPS